MFPQKEDNPFKLLFEAMVLSPSGAIIYQEKRGQTLLIESDVLPKNCERDKLEALGFVFGEDADDIFVYVKFPSGWKKVATEHAMWSNLLDDQGRVRAGIFYKAAYYDRSAHMKLQSRYSYCVEPIGGWDNYENKMWIGVVKDCSNIIWQTEPIEPQPQFHEREALREWYNKKDALEIFAEQWLEQHFSDWRNPLAYW